MSNTVAAVVVTYNRIELLKQCITALQSQTGLKELGYNLEIIVIDNAGSDGTESWAENMSQNGELIYLNTGSNLGGAGGFNYGLKFAAKFNYKYIWLMDDDCMPSPGALETLLKFAEANSGKFGFLASKVLWKDGSICEMNRQRQTLTRTVKSFDVLVTQVAMSSFVSLLIPTEVVRQLGLPIKEFYIWTDDWEYTRRISRRYPCYLINDSVVTHMTAKNTGAAIHRDTIDRLPRYRYLYRNDVYLYRREGLRGLAYELVRLGLHSARIITSADNKMKRLSQVVRGTIDGLSFRPRQEYCDTSERTIRVLEAFGEPISYGGEEAFVSCVLEKMNMDGLKVDCFTPYYADNSMIKRKLAEKGCELYSLGEEFNPGGNRLAVAKEIRKFLSTNYYDVIHIHSGSISMLSIFSTIAASLGIPKIIVHAHCDGIKNLKHSVIKSATNMILMRYPTHYCACSDIAARWMLPYAAQKQVMIIKNCIDSSRFDYRPELRDKLRAEFGIHDNERVIGCTARLTSSKNHVFLLQILAELIRRNKAKYRLLLVGDGEKRHDIIKLAHRLNIYDSIIMVGAVDNPELYYQAMDVFVLPTKFEGFSIVSMEAQASGLPVVITDKSTRANKLSDNIQYCSLNNIQDWIDAIENARGVRGCYGEVFAAKGYGISRIAEELRHIYLEGWLLDGQAPNNINSFI